MHPHPHSESSRATPWLVSIALACRPLLFALLALCSGVAGHARDVFAHYHTTVIPYYLGQDPNERRQWDVQAAVQLGLAGFVVNAGDSATIRGTLQGICNAADSLAAAATDAGKTALAAKYAGFKVFASCDMGGATWPAGSIAEMFGNTDWGIFHKSYYTNHYYKYLNLPVLSCFLPLTSGANNGLWGAAYWNGILNEIETDMLFITHARTDPQTATEVGNYQTMWTHDYQEYSWQDVADGAYPFKLPTSAPFPVGSLDLINVDAAGAVAESATQSFENFRAALGGNVFMGTWWPTDWQQKTTGLLYLETQGGQGMYNAWVSLTNAAKQNADLIEICTWNDAGESTHIQPVDCRDWNGTYTLGAHKGYYELLRYHIARYKVAGSAWPTVIRPSVFAFYRRQPKMVNMGGSPNYHPQPANWRGLVEDSIYITAALPADTSGTQYKVQVLKDGGNYMSGLFTAPTAAGPQQFIYLKVPITTWSGIPVINLLKMVNGTGVVVATATGPIGLASSGLPRSDFNVYSCFGLNTNNANGQKVTSLNWEAGDPDTWQVGDWFTVP